MQVCTQCRRLLPPGASACADDGAVAETVAEMPVGARIGAYRVERLLGEGGMGFVYECTHEVLKRRAAMKFLRPEFSSHTAVVARFLQEAKAVNVINHENIIDVYDYGDGEGAAYFVMEFLEGETLDDLMRRRHPMPLPLVVFVFQQMLRALAAAHAKQIVHRDLKPGNVFITRREDNPYFVKVLDFGIAKLRGEGAGGVQTMAGSVMGTPQYMSPEQVQGLPVDARSDVFSLAIMLYRAATGHAPFRGESFGELAGKILSVTPPVPSQVDPALKIPASFDGLVMRALERSVDVRTGSVAQMLTELGRIREELGFADDDALLAWATADHAAALGLPMPVEEPDAESTSASLAGSLPEYQGVHSDPKAKTRVLKSSGGAADAAASTAAAAAPESAKKKGSGAMIGVAAAILIAGGAAAYALLGGHGKGDSSANATPTAPAPSAAPAGGPAANPVTPPKKTGSMKDLAAAGNAAGARGLAEQALRDAIASGDLGAQADAVDAMGLVAAPGLAPLLYPALKGTPELRVKAGRALRELGLPDAAPKVRAAIDESGDKIRVELAASLLGLGDREGTAILGKGLKDPAVRLVAASALARSGDKDSVAAAKPVLAEIYADTPHEREPWRRAAEALLAAGDAPARAALTAELAQPDPDRAVAAAEILTRAGDEKAKAYLERVVADPEFTRRGAAALALAKSGDDAGLAWADGGLKSSDAGERRQAVAVCARFAKKGGASHLGEIGALAETDPDRGVRSTAQAALVAF